MGLFGSIKSAFKAGAKASKSELQAKYSANKDFLEAVCAGIALIAAADGDIEDSERGAALRLVQGNELLNAIYPSHQITECIERMLTQAKTVSGKQGLARQLDDIKTNQQMCEDTYLIAADIAMSDGDLEEAEKVTLGKIAKRLNVDVTKFEF